MQYDIKNFKERCDKYVGEFSENPTIVDRCERCARILTFLMAERSELMLCDKTPENEENIKRITKLLDDTCDKLSKNYDVRVVKYILCRAGELVKVYKFV